MRGKTHAAAGLATGLALVLACQNNVIAEPTIAMQIGTAALAALGSLTPDIDLPESTIGSKVKPISTVLNKTFGHRTLFHSPLLYAVIFLLTFKLNLCLALAFALGAVSHLLLDMLNQKGIPLLYPWKKTVHIASFSSDGIADLICRIILTAAALILFVAILRCNNVFEYIPFLLN
ncbi:MAG: metal-dependent hydrolase [Firmicutes bacterium]|nr:metal-dependent hydrolase [Bacillota bacterium]